MKPVTEIWAVTFTSSFNYTQKETLIESVKILIKQICRYGKHSSHSPACPIFIFASVFAFVIVSTDNLEIFSHILSIIQITKSFFLTSVFKIF